MAELQVTLREASEALDQFADRPDDTGVEEVELGLAVLPYLRLWLPG